MHSAATRTSAGSTSRLVTITDRSATDAGAPPIASAPASMTTGAWYRPVSTRRRLVASAGQTEPADRPRSDARNVLQHSGERRRRMRCEGNPARLSFANHGRGSTAVPRGELRGKCPSDNGRATASSEPEDAHNGSDLDRSDTFGGRLGGGGVQEERLDRGDRGGEQTPGREDRG